MIASSQFDERILILAPVGRDAPAMAALLMDHGITATVCEGSTELRAHIREGAGALLLTEEALELAQLPEFLDQLRAQPSWSELPVIILTHRGEPRLARLLDTIADAAAGITILERPIGTATLVRTVEVAVRSRRRQYQVRDLIAESVRQIAALTQAEEHLRRNQRHLELLANTIPALIFYLDMDRRYRSCNGAFADWFGVPPESVIGVHVQEFVGEPAWTIIAPNLERAYAGKTIDCEDEVPYRLGGARWIHAVYTPHIDEQGGIIGVIAFVNDITRSKEHEHTIRVQEERLRKVEKIAAAGQLAASLAHEINNPLAAVTNALYILQNFSGLPPETIGLVNTGAYELARVSRIVKQSLSYYRADRAPRETDLAQIVEESLRIFDERFQKAGLQVDTRINSGTIILGFGDEIRQAIDNLLLNALEATPRGGRVVVSLRCSRDWRDQRQPGGVRLTIADTGSGVPRGQLSNIFEPFFTTKAEKGNGLGLWVVRGIVSKHEGNIRIRSSTRDTTKGTVVSIFWPAPQRGGPRLKGNTQTSYSI